MKKKIVLTALMTLSTAPQAAPYIGIGGGYGNGSATLKTDYNAIIAANSVKKADTSIRGWNGTLFGGLGCKVCDRYYAGLELSADLSVADGKDKQTIGLNGQGNPLRSDVAMRYKRAFNASFKGGIYMNQKMLFYFKPGFSCANWKISSQYDQTKPARKSSHINGTRLGLGLQYTFAPNTDFGVEYSYTQYKKYKINHNTVNGMITHRVRPRLNLFIIQLMRHF